MYNIRTVNASGAIPIADHRVSRGKGFPEQHQALILRIMNMNAYEYFNPFKLFSPSRTYAITPCRCI